MVLVFPIVAPPGSTNVVMTVGTLTLVLCVVASIAAWKSPETYRLHGDDLGVPGAQPVPEAEYHRLRNQAIADAKAAKAAKAAA